MDVWSGVYMRATDLMGHGYLAKEKGQRHLKSPWDTNL